MALTAIGQLRLSSTHTHYQSSLSTNSWKEALGKQEEELTISISAVYEQDKAQDLITDSLTQLSKQPSVDIDAASSAIGASTTTTVQAITTQLEEVVYGGISRRRPMRVPTSCQSEILHQKGAPQMMWDRVEFRLI